MDEARIAGEPAHDLLDPLVFADRLGEPRAAFRTARELRQLALVTRLEGRAELGGALQVALHLRRIHAGIEVG